MRCRFCGQEHAWEIVKRLPTTAALMSIKAEDFLGRSVQNDVLAAHATNPTVRHMHEHMSSQWYQLAVEHETKAAALE